jgi:hypothetical protein
MTGLHAARIGGKGTHPWSSGSQVFASQLALIHCITPKTGVAHIDTQLQLFYTYKATNRKHTYGILLLLCFQVPERYSVHAFQHGEQQKLIVWTHRFGLGLVRAAVRHDESVESLGHAQPLFTTMEWGPKHPGKVWP